MAVNKTLVNSMRRALKRHDAKHVKSHWKQWNPHISDAELDEAIREAQK